MIRACNTECFSVFDALQSISSTDQRVQRRYSDIIACTLASCVMHFCRHKSEESSKEIRAKRVADAYSLMNDILSSKPHQKTSPTPSALPSPSLMAKKVHFSTTTQCKWSVYWLPVCHQCIIYLLAYYYGINYCFSPLLFHWKPLIKCDVTILCPLLAQLQCILKEKFSKHSPTTRTEVIFICFFFFSRE